MKTWTPIVIVLSTLLGGALALLVMLNLSLGNKGIDQPLQRGHAVADPAFTHLMSAVLSPPLVAGNRVRELINGNEIFPAMLGAIGAAEQSITLETYIYWSGSIGRQFSVALAERARRGVAVKVLLDWVGSDLDDELLDEMRAAGVEIRRYNALSWSSLARMNHRTHRRLLVVDGRIGFIGGVGLSDKWRGDAGDPAHWRDTHFQVEGPVVTQLQSAFIDNWLQTTGQVLHSKRFLPQPKAAGTSEAQVFAASPGGSSPTMQLLYLMSITSAARSIDLSAAYFVPDEVALDALLSALARGVRVRILMPGPHMDRAVVRRASRSLWGALLRGGAELYEYQPTMFHCKVMVVDALWVSVGSTNFDSRSFSINDEANLNVYDAAFARRQVEVFENDLGQSRRVTLESWQARSAWDKALDASASLLSSQL